MRVFRLLATATLVATTVAVHAQNRVYLYELDSRSPTFLSGVSTTGAVAVGTFADGGGFRWIPTSGVIYAGGLGANAVSGDGRTIVGNAADENRLTNAAIWQRGTEWRLLGGFPGGACDRSLSSALGVSRDGKTVVGQAYLGCAAAHAFRWNETSGMVDLGSSVAGRSSTAYAVSETGRVIVGEQTSEGGPTFGVRWVDGRQEAIPGPTGLPVGDAYGVNASGTIVVGRQCRPDVPDTIEQSAWIWRAGSGTQCLQAPALRPSPGPPVLVYAKAVSDDGRVVGGSQRIGTVDGNAVLWINGTPVYLKDYLRAHGVSDAFRGWPNTGEITGMTPDGRVLVGWGAAIDGYRGYVVILNNLAPRR
jgi:probable HAF family extracellular repeat protein